MNIRTLAKQNRLIVVAHRGSSGTAPENTMAAFNDAIVSGADMIETDIQLTNDGKLITFHDFTVKRTSKYKHPKSFDWQNLKDIDVGSWFDDRFAGERIPLLEQLFALAKDKIYLDIEIKARKNENYSEKIATLLKLIEDKGVASQIILCSFQGELLKEIRSQKPEIPLAIIKNPFNRHLPSKLVSEYNCDALICSVRELTHKLCQDAKENGIYVAVYGVNTLKQLKRALKYDIAAIATNFPQLVIDELKNMGKY